MRSYEIDSAANEVGGDGDSDKRGNGRGSSGGCHVSVLVGFVLVLLVLVLVAGVAVVVYFASTKDLTCTLDGSVSSGGIQGAVTSCKEWVENGGAASDDICGVCPSSQTTFPATTSSGLNTTTAPPYDRHKYRLPSAVTPSHYLLSLQPHIYGTDPSTFYFEGSVTIDVTCHDVTDVITLHRHESLAIEDSDVTVREKDSGRVVNVREISYEAVPEFYRLHLSENLRQNVNYQVVFARFSGPLKNEIGGLYVTSYMDGDRVVYLSASRFEPTLARKAFPCFDEPALKATFSVTLVRRSDTDRNYRSLSNTNRLRTSSSVPGWEEDEYETTMTMSTYLLAFVVSDFEPLTNNTMGVRYSTWARPNGVQLAGRAQELGVRIFEHFESQFLPRYSSVLKKLDSVALPGFKYGGLENWGLVAYSQDILQTAEVSALTQDRFLAYITSHEIVHMWFGNLVTPKWWNMLWMKEAMATFWHMQAIADILPHWKLTQEMAVEDLYGTMMEDALASSHPMTADVESPAEIWSMYSGVTYGKGSFIMRMMDFIMGRDNFVQALNNYLVAHKFQSTEPSDLLNALNGVSLPRVDMHQRMDPWLSQMGYPVVKVTRPGNGMLRMEQQRFLLGTEDDTDDRYKDPPYNYQWDIPITVASSQDANFTKTAEDIVWLEKNRPLDTIADPTVGDDSGWFVVNVQQYGYYRVNYDLQNWHNLIRQLNTDHQVIHPINRAQIINDAWNLVKADMLDMETALKIVEFLAKEVDYLPWVSFEQELQYVELMMEHTELYADLEAFLLRLVSGPLQQLGLDITPDLDPLSVYTRIQLVQLACLHGHPTCVSLAQQQVEDWRATGTNGIDANLRMQFYCTAVERGGQAEWNFLLEQFQTEPDATEKARRRQALACSREPALLMRLMQMAMQANHNHSMDVSQVITDVSRNRWGRDVAFQFVVEQLSPLADLLGSGMNSVIDSVTAHFKSEYDLLRLHLLESSGDTSAFASAIKQVWKRTRMNIDWLQKHKATLGTWLQQEEEPQQRLNYRLPSHVRPKHYEVELKPHIYGNDSSAFFFEGAATIHVECIDVTDDVIVHVNLLAIADSDISVRQENSQKELFQSSTYDEQRHFLHLHLTNPLEVGKMYELEFRHFSGPLTAGGNGLYLSHYRDQGEPVYLATTQMEPVYARKAFPCFDEPQLKATFDVTLVRRNDTGRHYISLCNAPLASSTDIQDSDGHWWTEDHFERTPIMSTYLLAFIVCDYLHLENTTASDPSVTYSTYARPNAIQWAERAQQYGLQIFDWFDRRFEPQFSHALSKVDNIAIPDFSFGAMENWGLITYRETLLYQPGVTPAESELWMGIIISHEIAHVWFGNYVSPKWWNWLWLNEAFASWWQVYATQQVLPAWKVEDNWMSSYVYHLMDSDALATSHPLTVDVQSPAEIGAIFDDVTYDKGAAIARMMQFIMGFDTFIDALNLYLDSNLYGNAEAATLFSALDQKMRVQDFGEDYVTTKMHPWVSQMGYPVVMVTRMSDGYYLTQKRFLIGSEEGTDDRYKDAPYGYQWEIPIIYATSENTTMDKSRDDIHWLSKNSHLHIPDSTANDTDAWILINVHQMAYCRVLYDTATWHALIGQLNRDPSVFPAINRGQIINDAWNLARAGMLDMSVALSTLDFLQFETELVPWRAFAREIHYVELMLERTDLFPLFRIYIQYKLQNPLELVTLDIDEDMVPTDVFVRTLIAEYACSYGLVGCVNVAKRLFAEWKTTGINGINANLRGQYYCTAVAEGDITDWLFVYTQYKSNDDTSELTNLRHALSCSRDQSLLRRLLTMALDPSEIRTQDLSSTIQFVAANPLGRDLAFQFFVDNFDQLQNSLEVLYFGNILTSVTGHFSTEYNLQQLQQLSEVRDVTVIRPVVDQVIAQTRSNIAWLESNYDVIKDWLTYEEPTPTTPAPGSYRLPTNLVPYHYDLRLQPHIYGNDPEEFFFEGSVTIFFTCISATSVITLHQDRLTLAPASITVTSVMNPTASLPVADVTEEEQFHFYKIHMRQPLTAGQDYSVSFSHLRGEMRRSREGLYLSSYKDGNRTVYLATTQMEPTFFRQVFPSFDEPALKATFNVTLVRRTDTDRDYISLSNMPQISSQVINASWTADTFQQTMKMSTYLLAFIVCDYLHLSNVSTKYPVETRTFARPNRIQDAQTAHEYSIELLDWFDDNFDPNYETYLPKVDHIAIPDFTAGAMENWGLITYRERLLYNSMSETSDRAWVAEVPSHELAHMWFGNKVSPKWWTWLWLNEAFANYWESYAVEQLYPDWKTSSVVDMTSKVFYTMNIDSYSSSHPMSNPVETPEEISDQFDDITYTKGGAIIGMMHMIMGEHFIPGLNAYLEDHLLGNVEHKDLFDSLNKYISNTPGIDLNMTRIMEPWVTQMGYPVVNVQRHGDQLVLTQQRFLMGSAPDSDTGAYGYKFEIPITYTTSSVKNFNISRTEIQWLHADDDSLIVTMPSADEDWAVLNLRHEGYYRVNYDVTMWKALIAQLNADHTVFDQMTRAALIDDAFSLVMVGLLPLDIALQTIDYMRKETEFGPWRRFAAMTEVMERMIERTELFADFKRFMQDLVDEPLKTIGLDPPADNVPPIEAFKLSWIVSYACYYDHVACVTKAKSSVSSWMNDLGNTINVNQRYLFYCVAVRDGGDDVWDFIYQKYQEEPDPTEKSRLRNALSCSKDPTVLYTFLGMCLHDEELPPRSQTPSCVSFVAGNRYGRDVAMNFVWENFPLLRERFSASALSFMVDEVTFHFDNSYHLAQLRFLRDTYDVSGIVGTLFMVEERTVTKMKRKENNFGIVKQWLADKYPGPSVKLDYRLPTSVAPYHYDLELRPEIYAPDPAAFTFTGTVTIWIEIREPTTSITLHSYLLDQERIRQSAKLLFDNGTDTGYVTEVTFDVPRHFLNLALSRELGVNETFRLYLEFSAPLTDYGVGLYYTSYRADDGTAVYLATTKFVAPYARRAFPCFDEPALKATVNVTLVRKDQHLGRTYRAWSNNMLLSTESRGDGYFADHFQKTPITPTYLLAFIVADFQCLTNVTKHNLEYSTCARPNGFMYGQLAQEWGLKEMEWLEDHFEPPYIMPKLDNMAIPYLPSSAIENWGLITYQEYILYQEGLSFMFDKDRIVEFGAHELAHMWFGNIVSPQWWSWLWLNEGFASFWGFHLVDLLDPSWRKTDEFVVQSMHSVMSSDSLMSSHPLTVDVESPSEIEAIFDSITFSKGAAIVRMMHFVMGDDQFIAGLNVYLNDRQYDVANNTHLFDALDKYLSQQGQSLNMSEVMEPWVTQKNFPVVHVHWSAAGQIRLTQSRYLSSGQGSGDDAEDQAPFGYTWDIPITMATSSSSNYQIDESDVTWFWKSEPQMTISNTSIPAPPTPGDLTRWVLLNVQQYGYYRVNYPENNWLALIEQLRSNLSVIHPINRAQIINDAWSLVKSGHLSMSIALQTLNVLKNDDDYVPWSAVFGELSYLNRMLGQKDIYGTFQDYMVHLVNETFEDIGMTNNANDAPIQIHHRQHTVSFACWYGLQSCIDGARQQFGAWRSDPANNKIDVDMQALILCNGVRFGSKEDWEFVYEQYLNATHDSEKLGLLSALTCSRESWLLHRLMDLTLDPTIISAQDVGFVIQLVSGNAIGQDMAFTFLEQHFNQLSNLVAPGSFGGMVLTLTEHFNTQQQLDEVKRFMSQNDVSVAQTSFRQVLQRTSVNIQWMNDHYDQIQSFLLDSDNWR